MKKEIRDQLSYNPILPLIRKIRPYIADEEIYTENFKEIETRKYEIIICNIPMISTGLRKDQIQFLLGRLDTYKSNLRSEGFLFFICSENVLKSVRFLTWRKKILENFSVAGILSLNFKSFNTLSHQMMSLPVSIIILNKQNEEFAPFLSILITEDELEPVLRHIIDQKESSGVDVFITDKIKADSFDPYYYHPKYQTLENDLKKFKTETLGSVADIILGARYNKKILLKKGRWKFIRPRDILEYKIKKDHNWFINDNEANLRLKSKIKLNDLIITRLYHSKADSFRYFALITTSDCPAIVSDSFFIIRCKKIDPLYLFNLLKTEVGRKLILTQIERKSKTMGSISHTDLVKIKLPILSENLMSDLTNVSSLEYQSLIDLRGKLKLQINVAEKENTIKQAVLNELSEIGWPEDSIIEELRINQFFIDLGLKINDDLVLVIELKQDFSLRNKEKSKNMILQMKKLNEILSIQYVIIINSFYEIALLDLTKDAKSHSNSFLSIERFPSPHELINKDFTESIRGAD